MLHAAFGPSGRGCSARNTLGATDELAVKEKKVKEGTSNPRNEKKFSTIHSWAHGGSDIRVRLSKADELVSITMSWCHGSWTKVRGPNGVDVWEHLGSVPWTLVLDTMHVAMVAWLEVRRLVHYEVHACSRMYMIPAALFRKRDWRLEAQKLWRSQLVAYSYTHRCARSLALTLARFGTRTSLVWGLGCPGPGVVANKPRAFIECHEP